jgi:hypothetical protein
MTAIKKMLLVDDEENMRKAIVRLIRKDFSVCRNLRQERVKKHSRL